MSFDHQIDFLRGYLLRHRGRRDYPNSRICHDRTSFMASLPHRVAYGHTWLVSATSPSHPFWSTNHSMGLAMDGARPRDSFGAHVDTVAKGEHETVPDHCWSSRNRDSDSLMDELQIHRSVSYSNASSSFGQVKLTASRSLTLRPSTECIQHRLGDGSCTVH